ncbi:thioredoxin family protein [Marinilongibacter aquaticus]|uniref:thioredoxin family protein n=1 Tax=Marinilongibacter aquaticus TaxID=2975157 RepID=UPI0021BDEEF3|nr:thioredoxin family protein [Marinilongibacter aquaticus]UBM60960.1 thioredoxin family protein [Marinilongibacter aquaticus]
MLKEIRNALWIACTLFVLTSMSGQSTDEFKGTYDECLREAQKQNKGIVLHFWANWCPPCNKQRRLTFSDEKLKEFLEDRYLVYLVDVDTADGKAIAERFDVELYPSVVVLDNKAKKQSQFTGLAKPSFLLKKLQGVQL